MNRQTRRRAVGCGRVATCEKHKGRQSVANGSRAVGRPCNGDESKGVLAKAKGEGVAIALGRNQGRRLLDGFVVEPMVNAGAGKRKRSTRGLRPRGNGRLTSP